jgi:hypothetical protein
MGLKEGHDKGYQVGYGEGQKVGRLVLQGEIDSELVESLVNMIQRPNGGKGPIVISGATAKAIARMYNPSMAWRKVEGDK